MWTTDSATCARPIEGERLAEYAPLPDQRYVWIVTYRNPKAQGNWFGRTIGRWVIRLMCFLGRTTTPAPYDLMGAEFSEERAVRHCEDANWSVMGLPLGTIFPKERVRWKWNYSPRRFLNWNRERSTAVPLYEPVERSKLEAFVEKLKRLSA